VEREAEREKTTKELTKFEGQLANAQRRLDDEQFLSKAPAHVVEGLRKQVAELKIVIEKLRKRLEGLE
jgi:valyl-tRNA synthetase